MPIGKSDARAEDDHIPSRVGAPERRAGIAGPRSARRAATETLLARENGRAELERARAEAAALRTLANAARLLEAHPALLQLRAIQAAATPGTTIVLGADPHRPPVSPPAA